MQNGKPGGLFGDISQVDPHATNAGQQPMQVDPHYANGPASPEQQLSPEQLMFLQGVKYALQGGGAAALGAAGGVGGALFGPPGAVMGAGSGAVVGGALGGMASESLGIDDLLNHSTTNPTPDMRSMPLPMGRARR